jgi:hypothetical protein
LVGLAAKRSTNDPDCSFLQSFLEFSPRVVNAGEVQRQGAALHLIYSNCNLYAGEAVAVPRPLTLHKYAVSSQNPRDSQVNWPPHELKSFAFLFRHNRAPREAP